MTDETKRTWAEISLPAIEHNYRELRSRLPDGCRFLGVVKADAYGHGAVKVAELLGDLGCEYLAVACLEEARELRGAGNELPILIFGYTPPSYAPELAKLNLTQTVGSLDQAKGMSGTLAGTGKKLKIHIKIDSGMCRLGFSAPDAVQEAAEAAVLPQLIPEGIYTHFAISDLSSDPFTLSQFERFRKAVGEIEALSGIRFEIRHCANSAAVINYPQTYLDMVRPGLALYGMYPCADTVGLELRPAMALKSRISRVCGLKPGDTVGYGRTFMVESPIRAACVQIGYADGLHRILSNKMDMLINGRRVRQIGRICMDMCMVDVTGLPGVSEGDEVTVFGGGLPIDEQAANAETITYELVCAVSKRVPRVYH